MSRHDEINAMTMEERELLDKSILMRVRAGATAHEIGVEFRVCPCCILPQILKPYGWAVDENSIVRIV